MMKRKLSKITAILVVASMAVVSLAFTTDAGAQAMPVASLVATPASVAPGGSGAVDVSLQLDGVDYSAGLYTIAYDPAVVTITNCDYVVGEGACNEMQTGVAVVGQFIVESPFMPNDYVGGPIIRLDYQIDASATAGTSTPFDLEVIDFYADSVNIGAIAIDTSVTIAEPEPEPEPQPHQRYRRWLRWLLRFLSRWSHRTYGWR